MADLLRVLVLDEIDEVEGLEVDLDFDDGGKALGGLLVDFEVFSVGWVKIRVGGEVDLGFGEEGCEELGEDVGFDGLGGRGGGGLRFGIGGLSWRAFRFA